MMQERPRPVKGPGTKVAAAGATGVDKKDVREGETTGVGHGDVSGLRMTEK